MSAELRTQNVTEIRQLQNMEKSPEDLRKRTKRFALCIIKLVGSLPRTPEAQGIGRQLFKSGTSVGANYRESLRARSKSENAAKMNISLMELEETAYWLELLEEGQISQNPEVNALKAETDELLAIFVTMIKRVRKGAARGL